VGAWGTGPFDNDDAGDWVYALEDGGPGESGILAPLTAPAN